MKEEKDYIRDIAEIRSMMERSSKFLSLSGWAGIMAGIYALAGAYIANTVFQFNPDEVAYRMPSSGGVYYELFPVILLGSVVLLLAIGTAVVLSHQKANKQGEKIWNATSRRLLMSMAVPLVTGGLLILLVIARDLAGLMAPFTLIFYGLALYNASRFTFGEVKFLGMIQIGLGLISAWYIGYGLLLWAIGFGIVHILYGIYLHFRYER